MKTDRINYDFNGEVDRLSWAILDRVSKKWIADKAVKKISKIEEAKITKGEK